MARHLTAVVAGEPQPKERPRLARNGHVYTPQRTRDAEARVAEEVKAQNVGQWGDDWWPTGCDVSVSVRFLCTRTDTDLDNLVKLYLDSLNGLIWVDDRQVIAINASLRRVDANPRTHLEVLVWEG